LLTHATRTQRRSITPKIQVGLVQPGNADYRKNTGGVRLRDAP
jgi:hypothetical protein